MEKGRYRFTSIDYEPQKDKIVASMEYKTEAFEYYNEIDKQKLIFFGLAGQIKWLVQIWHSDLSYRGNQLSKKVHNGTIKDMNNNNKSGK